MTQNSKTTDILGATMLILLLAAFLNNTFNITSLSFERLLVFSLTAFFGSLIVDTSASDKMKGDSMMIALFLTFFGDFLLSYTQSYNQGTMLYMVGIFITTWLSILNFKLKRKQNSK